MSIESLKTGPVRPSLPVGPRRKSRRQSGLPRRACGVILCRLLADLPEARGGRVAHRAGGTRPPHYAGRGVAGLAAARQAPNHRIAPGARRRLDHFAPFPPADGGHAVARHPDGRGCDPDPGAFGMPAAHRRLAAGARLRLSACLSCLLDTPAELAARRVHRAAEGMDFRYRIQLSLRSRLPGGAERRHDHDRLLRAHGQRRLFRHEFDLRPVCDRRFLCS